MARDYFTLNDQGKSWQICLPDSATNHIQKEIRETGQPYEPNMLHDMASRLKPGDHVLDIGANIGNHSLYLAAVCGCQVTAFESDPHLAATLTENVAKNGFEKRIRIITKGLGDPKVTTLDQMKPRRKVKLVKVSAEGMEITVLHGAGKLISEQRPAFYVECGSEENFRKITAFMQEQNYRYWDSFNSPATHLFLPAEIISPEKQMQHLMTREALNAYSGTRNLSVLKTELHETQEKLNQARTERDRSHQALDEANAKYRVVTAQLTTAREELAGHQDAAEAAKAALEATAEMKISLYEAQERQKTVEADKDKLCQEFTTLEQNHDSLAAELAFIRDEAARNRDRAESTEAALIRTQAAEAAAMDEIRELEARLHHAFTTPAKAVEETSGLSPRLAASWALALPLPPETIAREWLGLAQRLQQAASASQARALLEAVHQLHPSADSAYALGLARIEAGDGAGGLALLDPVVEGRNLSSRAERLLDLARAGHEGAKLRRRAARAVRSRLRLAAIMDEFTAAGYAPECDLQQLSLGNWRAELDTFRPEMVLIESAWRGLHEEWGGRVGHLSQEIQDILEWCHLREVPTAFWNKEDPVHFESFLTTAQKFDLVFTTDIDCVPRYKAKLGHDRVHLLPFACQPEVHNPVEIGPRKAAFCFAGAYYTRYPARTRDLDDFLEELTQHLPFEIFDRNFGKDHPDYMFPENYRPYIVGTLPPSEIDRAYKGYEFGINLNSVKHSQSMYARRVYELLACNTRVVSNYSPGLRVMFGDLVVSTDSGAEALRRIRRQDETDQAGRIRLAGLRKALSQHSYSHRLGYIAQLAGLAQHDVSALPQITVLARAENQAEAESLITAFTRQSLENARMVLVSAEEVTPPHGTLPTGLRVISPDEAADLRLGDLIRRGEWLAGFVATDHYGTHYLEDLLLATRYSNAPGFGKAAFYHVKEDRIGRIEGAVYTPVPTLAARRALLRQDLTPEARLDRWLADLPKMQITLDPDTDESLLALDPFNYCENGASDLLSLAEITAITDDLPDLDPGIACADLQSRAAAMQPALPNEIRAPIISAATLAGDIPLPAARTITGQVEGNSWILSSTLPDGTHLYLYEKGERPVSVFTDQGLNLHAQTGPGLGLLFVAVFLDAKRRKLGHQMLNPNHNYTLDPPDGTEFIRLGIRVRGSGSGKFQGFILGKHHPEPRDMIARSRVLLLTNHYPSYEDIYRNGFVHSRIRGYRELGGVTPDVFRLRPGQDTRWHEFQNVDCMTGSTEQLDTLLASGQHDHILVHFLDETMWQVLARHIDRLKVTVWVHGAEVQPWWRRRFNFRTEKELDAAKPVSDHRLAFWRSLFQPLHANLHFVFVSQYFADEVFEDLRVTCPPSQYEIIHNPIDDQLFAYHEKTARHRGRILSIRPFASAKYANDQSVKAILSLQERDFFRDLEFRIVGDGPLFDEVTAPLNGLPNVICEKRFLTQPEIASLHREYGIFLNPTRMDAQGVSRDEAMSSGLVPVTTRIAAIPEFVDETCGYLAEPEDAEGLARAITDLWKNPETFLRKSRTAAERVRQQSGKEKMIRAELTLLGHDIGG
ncbi:MAG: FkbM family methyltransferase [Pseudorhodobacter sp.]